MTRATTKANADAADPPVLIVLGYDEDQKPRAARFPAADANLVAKAAQLMDLKVYEATTEELADLAKKLPVGRLYSNGKGFVPNIRQTLYSQIIVALAGEPGRRSAKTKTTADRAPACQGPGTRLRLATSSSRKRALEYGWWEAI